MQPFRLLVVRPSRLLVVRPSRLPEQARRLHHKRTRRHFCHRQGPSGRRQRFKTCTTTRRHPRARPRASAGSPARPWRCRGQGQRIADTYCHVEQLGRLDRLIEPSYRPVQSLRLAEVGLGPLDHRRANVGPFDPQTPRIEHRRMLPRAASHVDAHFRRPTGQTGGGRTAPRMQAASASRSSPHRRRQSRRTFSVGYTPPRPPRNGRDRRGKVIGRKVGRTLVRLIWRTKVHPT